MKKLSIIVLLLIINTLHAQEHTNNLTIDIRGRDCKGGLSLCTIELSTNKISNTPSKFLKKLSDTELQLSIVTSSLSLEEQLLIFGKSLKDISGKESYFFTQAFDLEINASCLEILALNPKYTVIKSGVYPLHIKSDQLVTVLKLTTKN
jgi:hypothetical protein